MAGPGASKQEARPPRPVAGRAAEGATGPPPGHGLAPRRQAGPSTATAPWGRRPCVLGEPPALPGPPPPSGQQPVAATLLEQELAPSLELVSSVVLGAWSSSFKLCLSFLICHTRTEMLPPCFSCGRCRVKRSRLARDGGRRAGRPPLGPVCSVIASLLEVGRQKVLLLKLSAMWGAGSDPQKGVPALGACLPEKLRPPSAGTGTSQKWEPTGSCVEKRRAGRKEGCPVCLPGARSPSFRSCRALAGLLISPFPSAPRS